VLKKYDAMLSGVRESDDYWYDVAMSDAIVILEAFSDEQWDALEELLAVRPPLWQVSCAETLSEVSNQERGFDLLMALMQVGNDDVMVAALDSINALASYGLDIAGKAPQLRGAITKAKDSAGAAVSHMLSALEDKLPPA